MAFVFKVKYKSTLRRMTVKEAKDGTPDISFKELEAKIYGMFQIPIDNELVVTYIDQDKETVTMGGDIDINDACIVQRIDPLHMEVKLQKTKPDLEEHKNVTQSKSLQRSSVVQLLVDSVNNSPFCPKTAALPKQLLSNDVKSFPGVAEAPYFMHKGVPFHKDVQYDGCSDEAPLVKSIRRERDHSCNYERYENSTISQRQHNRSMVNEGKMGMFFNSQSTALAPKRLHSAKVPAWKLPVYKHTSRFDLKKGNYYRFKNLDARFVKHLTIPDGTEVCVGAHFTKSWRIRNMGSLPWPSATQLVCVGGDTLGSQKPFTLKIPYSGLLIGEEIDASVDLVAPGRPGRFVSYWRLMAPTGQKFGHRIWVVIQAIAKPQGFQQLLQAADSLVEQSHKKFIGMEEPRKMVQCIGNDIIPSCIPSHKLARDGKEHKHLSQSLGLDLESPEVITSHSGEDGPVPSLHSLLLSTKGGKTPVPWPQSSNLDGHKTMGNTCSPIHTDEEHVTDSNLVKCGADAFPLVEELDVKLLNCETSTTECRSAGKWLADVWEPPKSEKPRITIDPGQVELLEAAEDCDCQEDIILGMLHSMGFTQRTLNLELLHKNKNDMLETVDDLVVASEWDHILDELEELGFNDADMNC